MWPFGPKREKSLGARGETLARRYLGRRGLKILARNYRCPRGEIDLIALDRSTRKKIGAETLVFVEVKTRTSDKYTDPESAVDTDKRRRIGRIAEYYLASRKTGEYHVRFDIVSVLVRDDEKPQIRHMLDAF